MGRIALSDGEWKVMNALWKQPPKTIMQLTKELKEETDWGKNVIITMLNRLEAKGAVIHEAGGRAKQFYPAVDREDTVLEETKGFLERVYEGSVTMMVDAMVNSGSLSKSDIEELYDILQKAEEETADAPQQPEQASVSSGDAEDDPFDAIFNIFNKRQ